jgi:hypothetical protein
LLHRGGTGQMVLEPPEPDWEYEDGLDQAIKDRENEEAEAREAELEDPAEQEAELEGL